MSKFAGIWRKTGNSSPSWIPSILVSSDGSSASSDHAMSVINTSDQDSPSLGPPSRSSTLVDIDIQDHQASTISGLPPTSCPPSMASVCIKCPGHWKWQCDHGHQTTDTLNTTCPSPDDVRCSGGCGFSYRDDVAQTKRGAWRRRGTKCYAGIQLVLGLGILGALITLIYVFKTSPWSSPVPEVLLTSAKLVTTSAPYPSTGWVPEPRSDPDAMIPFNLSDPDNSSHQLEHPDALELAYQMGWNSTS